MEFNVAARGGFFLCWLLCLGCVTTIGGIPIPATYDGFSLPLHSTNGPVVIEAFIDPICIDCKTSWPTITKVVEKYGPAVSLVVHPFPVPFHHNAFFSARALHIAASLNASSIFPLLDLIFKKQDSFLNGATGDETPASVVSRFVELAAEIGLPANKFKAGFTDSSTDQSARISFKYGCSRYVTSTPSFLVNGIYLAADETWSLEQWANVLDPLIHTGCGNKMVDQGIRRDDC